MKRTFILLLLLAHASASLAQLSGPLSGALGPGTFHVIDTISVESTDTLRLLPATTFIFDGLYPFQIHGTLLAEGTETDSIIFMASSQGSPGRWRGLQFLGMTSSGGMMAYCLIQHGRTGVSCSSSSPMFTHCSIRNNSGYDGAGVYCCEGSSPTFMNCTISGNAVDGFDFGVGFGAGVLCWGQNTSPTFTDCSIDANTAFGPGFLACCGGGVACEMDASPIFTNCTINHNTAVSQGGGVYCSSHSFPFFTSCIISGNRAADGGDGPGIGGGVCCTEGSSPSFVKCSIIGNFAQEEGDGVYCWLGWFGEHPPSPIFNSTIIAFSEGEGIYFDSIAAESRITHCNIFGNGGGSFGGRVPAGIGDLVTTNANGDSCDIYMNIFLDPMFVDAAAGDYHLLAGSPCIDAGDPTLPFDPDSTIADIGAFYFHQLAAEPLVVLLPTAYALHPNWPNPFNSSTMIRYDVPQAGKVSLTIFNLLGQRVTTLFDSRQLAGSYTVSWDAANMPSGVYLCRMDAASFVQTRKLVLVK